MFLLQECVKNMVICTRDFTAACNLRTPPPLKTYLLSSPPLPSSLHFSLCPLDSFPSLVPACFKKAAAAGRQIFPELKPISYHAGEITEREHSGWEGKVGQAPFYKHTERREVCMCVCVYLCVCVCVCWYVHVFHLFLWRGFKQAKKSFIYTSDKLSNTSIPWLMD